MKKHLLSAIILTALITSSTGAFQFFPYEDCWSHMQPSYETFMARMWGAGFIVEYETSDGYTITYGTNGYMHYATLDSLGEYAPSDSLVAINQPPAESFHLRRSAARIAELQAEMEAIRAADGLALEQYWPRRDNPVEFRLGILLWETDAFEGAKVGWEANNDSFLTRDYLVDMFVSDDWNYSNEDSTIDKYPACGSVRDYYIQVSNGNVLFTAGDIPQVGDIPARTLLINPYDEEGNPLWLRANGAQRPASRLIDSCIARGWLPQPNAGDPVDPGFDFLITIHPHQLGKPNSGGGFNKAGWQNAFGTSSFAGVYLHEGNYHYPLDRHDEMQFQNVSQPIHEIAHKFNLRDLYDECPGDYDHYFNYPAANTPEARYQLCGGFVGGFDPMGGSGGDFIDVGGGDTPIGNSAGLFNPQYRAALGWISDFVELTGDTSIAIGYSTSEPTMFGFRYYFPGRDESGGRIRHGAFYLENRQCLPAGDEDGDYVDFNSRMPGWAKWKVNHPWNRKGYIPTPYKNNLLIWHVEGDNFWHPDSGFIHRGLVRDYFVHLQFADGHAFCTNPRDPYIMQGADSAEYDGSHNLNGNDLFPGAFDKTEFGPGTYENTNNPKIDYSSRDIMTTKYAARDSRQTGFCVKNIVVDEDVDSIYCDVYTNYWGGDVTENLVLEGTNIYLGQECEIQDGSGINVSGANDQWNVHLDSDVTVNDGGSLIFDSEGNDFPGRVYLNDHRLNILDGANFEINDAPNDEEVIFHGPGRMDWRDDDDEITIECEVTIDADDGPWILYVRNDIRIVEGGHLIFDPAGGHGEPSHIYLYGGDIIEDGGELTYGAGGAGERVITHVLGQRRVRSINGQMNIQGASNARHLFTSDEASPARGDWVGLEIEDATEALTISYCDIEYASVGIKADDCGSYITLDNVTVTDFEDYGFKLVSSSPTMDNCSASNSTPSGAILPVGLYSYNSSPDITNSDFDNNYRGVEVYGSSGTFEMGTSSASDNASDGAFFYDSYAYLYYNAIMTDNGYNSFIGNGDEGVSAGGYAGVYMGNGSYSPGNNSIYDNYAYDLANYTAYTIMAEYNWWGDILGPSNNYGYVDSDPFLTSAPGSFAPVDNGDHFVDGVDDDVDDLLQYADSLFDCDETNDALAAYQAILADYPDDARILNTVDERVIVTKGLTEMVIGGNISRLSIKIKGFEHKQDQCLSVLESMICWKTMRLMKPELSFRER